MDLLVNRSVNTRGHKCYNSPTRVPNSKSICRQVKRGFTVSFVRNSLLSFCVLHVTNVFSLLIVTPYNLVHNYKRFRGKYSLEIVS